MQRSTTLTMSVPLLYTTIAPHASYVSSHARPLGPPVTTFLRPIAGVVLISRLCRWKAGHSWLAAADRIHHQAIHSQEALTNVSGVYQTFNNRVGELSYGLPGFNLAYENAGPFRDFIDTARIFVPPVVTCHLLASYAHTGERNARSCSKVYTDANGREYIDSQRSHGHPRRWPPHNPWRCGRSARGVLP
jgi:hypothetical protein